MPRNTSRAQVVLAIASAVALASPAHAQPSAARRALPGWVEDDPFSSDDADPLGIDRADRLETVRPTTPEEELAPSVPVQRGAVLSAIAGVRETAHQLDVRLLGGLAHITAEMRFESRARHDAEIRYRLAVPEGASLAGLEVCNAEGCRDGLVDASSGPLGAYDDAVRAQGQRGRPVGHAGLVEDVRGHAVWLRAAPVRPGRVSESGRVAPHPLTVRVSYVVPAPVQGGRVRFQLPARGHDNRVAAAEVRMRSDVLLHGEVDGTDAVERSVSRVAWEPMELTARVDRAGPAVETTAWIAEDESGAWLRVHAVAAPRSIQPRDVILLLDASPSTVDGARGRIAPTIAALLSSLPSQSRVSVAAFAARAVPVVPTPSPPTDISLTDVARSLEQDLGSTTRFESAWSLVGPWAARMRRPLVVLVGDGGLTDGVHGREAFRAAARAGVEVTSLNVADRPSQPALLAALGNAGRTIDAGDAADAAARGHGADPLRERIARLFAPVVREAVVVRAGRQRVTLGPLRAGEERVWEGAIRGRVTVEGSRARSAPTSIVSALVDRIRRQIDPTARPLRLAAVGATAAPNVCRVSGPFESEAGVVQRGVHLALADTRRCDTPAVPEAPRAETLSTPDALNVPDASSLPRRVLRDMLRQRLIPPARACYRDDRAGRANYAQRAVYRFQMADREVIDAEVVGAIAPRLRDCLLRAVDDLDVPRFDGSITVSYPLYTAAHLPPPTLSLDADVADAVDAVADEPPSTDGP